MIIVLSTTGSGGTIAGTGGADLQSSWLITARPRYTGDEPSVCAAEPRKAGWVRMPARWPAGSGVFWKVAEVDVSP